MPISITCPECDARIRAPDSVEGRPVKCPKCGGQFTAAAGAMPLPQPTAHPANDPAPEPVLYTPPEPPLLDHAPPGSNDWVKATKSAPNLPSMPLSQPSATDASANVLMDLVLFRKLVAPLLIQLLFWFGILGCVVVGGLLFADVLSLLNRGAGFGPVTGALLRAFAVWFLGPLVVRVHCEVLILFFRINDQLTDIKENLQRRA